MTERTLHTTDKAIIAAAAGAGDESVKLVELTPELMESIGKVIDARTKEIKESFPRIVAECPAETRLALAAWVIEKIVENAKENGSFRNLIYGRLEFGPEAYLPLYLAGAMEITNNLVLDQEVK